MSTPAYPRCRVRLQLLLEDWTGTGAGSQTFDLAVDPIEVTIERNDHRTADKATVTLDLREGREVPGAIVKNSRRSVAIRRA